MARQQDIRYINSFVSGNVAYQMEPKRQRPVNTAKLPKLPRQPRKEAQPELLLSTEPFAVLSVAVCVILLVMLTVGVFQCLTAHAEKAAMEQYVQTLQTENAQLQDTYTSGYDLTEIEEMALAMGMIPIEQAEHITVSVAMPVVPAQTQQLNFWDRVVTFLTGFFA